MQSDLILNPSARAGLLPVAAKVFWWGTPEDALQDVYRFAAQVMTFGDWDDVQTTRRFLGESVLRSTLENAPPGVFDSKSWNYWHVFFHIAPIPPLPQRRL